MKDPEILADVEITKRKRAHVVITQDGATPVWYATIVECFDYLIDNGFSTARVKDDTGIYQVIFERLDDPDE